LLYDYCISLRMSFNKIKNIVFNHFHDVCDVQVMRLLLLVVRMVDLVVLDLMLFMNSGRWLCVLVESLIRQVVVC